MADVTATAARTARAARDRALRGTARGGLLNLLGAAVAGGGGLAITWLAAAGLGATGAGQFFAATAAFLVAVAFARLGTPTGLVYWIARCRTGDPAGLDTVLRSAVVPVAVASTVTAVVAFTAAPVLSGWKAGGGPEYTAVLRALAVFVPAAVAMELLLAATRGFQRMRATVVVDKLGRTLAQLVLLAVTVWWLETGPLGVALAWALPYVPAAVAAGWWWRGLRRDRSRRTVAPGPVSAPVTPAAFWRYTSPRAVAGTAHLLLQRIDILLVAAMLGFSEAALYTVATRFVTVAQLVSGAVGSAVQPRLATSMSGGDLATARTLYQVTTGWIVLVCWPLLLAVGWSAPWYLSVFGAEYVSWQGVAVVWLLVAGMLVATGCGVVDSVLVMAGRGRWQLYNVVTALAVNVVLNLWLIPAHGVVGAAVAWAVSLALNNVVPLVQLAAGHRLHPFGTGTGLAAAVAAFWFGAVPAVSLAWWGPTALPETLAVSAVATAATALVSRRRLVRPRGDGDAGA
ncbi:O-antigen/teichoic acid export membrane protein [Stackebrandtia albiflava]|uniref:O-antigen/teichoic acid export membrane protein n=1 Tax=Stackebrandtia albiflava TaxID=406432 RepID=A0A562V408_9ACTN|nr:O-antigen/teichoic acid export membrane protein [Stackebrandtia albiflava]